VGHSSGGPRNHGRFRPSQARAPRSQCPALAISCTPCRTAGPGNEDAKGSLVVILEDPLAPLPTVHAGARACTCLPLAAPLDPPSARWGPGGRTARRPARESASPGGGAGFLNRAPGRQPDPPPGGCNPRKHPGDSGDCGVPAARHSARPAGNLLLLAARWPTRPIGRPSEVRPPGPLTGSVPALWGLNYRPGPRPLGLPSRNQGPAPVNRWRKGPTWSSPPGPRLFATVFTILLGSAS